MSINPSCLFWDGCECHYEPLMLGCQPCAECPPEEMLDFSAVTTMLVAGVLLAEIVLHPGGIMQLIYLTDWNDYASRFTD